MTTWLLAAIDPEPDIPLVEASLVIVGIVILLVAAVLWIPRKPSS